MQKQSLESTGADHPGLGRRTAERSRAVLLMGKVVTGHVGSLCLVCDVSPYGARIKTTSPLAVDTQVTLDLGNEHVIDGVVKWGKAGQFGIEFREEVDPRFLLGVEQERDSGHDEFHHHHRRAPRNNSCRSAKILSMYDVFPGCLNNISPQGACIETETAANLKTGAPVLLKIDGFVDVTARVKWSRQLRIGVVFDSPLLFSALDQWLAVQAGACAECTLPQCAPPRSAPEREAARA